jgi:hypothetical protein
MAMYDSVQKVNKLLEDQGAAAVQKFAKLKSTGRDIYGYQPQRVFDAMGEVFGPDGWHHDIISANVIDGCAIARISVTIGERSSEQFGEHRITAKDLGSAYKAAVTDGIQKALSLFGVGAKAYRGELADVFNSKVSKTEVDADYEVLKDEAKRASRVGIKESRQWWRRNLVYVQNLTTEQRAELVEILGDKQ